MKGARPANLVLFGLSLIATTFIWLYASSTSHKCASLLNNNGLTSAKLPEGTFFVAQVPPYVDTCGGCIVMHMLVHELNRLFGTADQPIAYIVPLPNDSLPCYHLNPGYITPMLPAWLNASDGIAIYVEGQYGNYLNARYVVRYMLYFKPEGAPYNKDEMIICWTMGYCESLLDSYELMHVQMIAYDFDIYKSLPKVEQRQGTLILIKKNHFTTKDGVELRRTPDEMEFEGVRLNKDTPKRQRLEMFAAAEMFISYDAASFINVEAAVAGCVSVVIPFPNVSREEWLKSVGNSFIYGVAYGMEEIDYAKATMAKVMPHLQSMATAHIPQLHRFMEGVNRKLHGGSFA